MFIVIALLILLKLISPSACASLRPTHSHVHTYTKSIFYVAFEYMQSSPGQFRYIQMNLKKKTVTVIAVSSAIDINTEKS